jgi:monoamine oxidase
VGTHYYKPGIEKYNSLSNPEPNIYVVGEMVSKKQGWVEGALESVETIL